MCTHEHLMVRCGCGVASCEMPAYMTEVSALHALRTVMEETRGAPEDVGLVWVCAGDPMFCQNMNTWCNTVAVYL